VLFSEHSIEWSWVLHWCYHSMCFRIRWL